jgi:heavy metal sensor kinase
MTKPLSIKLRLSLLVSLPTLAIIAVVSIAAYVELEEALLRNVDEILRAEGEGIMATLDEPESSEYRETELRSIIGNGKPRYPVWCRVWMDGSETDLFARGALDDAEAERLLHPAKEEQPNVGESSFFNVGREADRNRQSPSRMMWMRRLRHGEIVNVLVGRSTHYVYHELGEFYRFLLIIGVSLTLLTMWLVHVLIGWGLLPIAQAGVQLQTITHKSLGQDRARAAIVPELKPFMKALDDMLTRLDEAMRRQEQFIADAAHELRTPVAIIKSTLQTTRLQRRGVAEYEESIEETLQDIGRLERLMEQLLSLARLERPDKVGSFVEVRLDTLLGETIGVFQARAAEQGARIVFQKSSPVSLRGDESQLRQLFSNLLDNALRHGPSKGTVRVALEGLMDHRITVSVHDEGGQIPADALPHLFDRFYRVDSSRSRISGGSGLGLAIAREIVRRHGGDIRVTSDPQHGTLVVVHLPKN